jgi:hypothetical protein
MTLNLQGKLIIFLIISLIIFTGCSDKSGKYNYINYKELKRPNNTVKKLHSTVVNKYDVYTPGALAIINNYLLFIDYKADELIKINDLKSYKLLKSFGRLGQGPSEFIGASEIIPSPKDKNIFWIYDFSTQNLKKFNINKVLNNEFNPEEIIQIKGGNGIATQLIITPDNEILGIGLFFKGRISIYNMSGDFIRSVGKIPVILKNERFASQNSHGFTGRFILKNESKEIFIATKHGAIVEKYNIGNGKLISTFYGPDSFFPEYEIVQVGEHYTMTYNKKTRFGYLDICYNKKLDRLFLLYSGEYQQNKGANFSNIVYVLNNKGTIIEEIELDNEIIQMAISDDGSTIFGVSRNEILKFEYYKKPQ